MKRSAGRRILSMVMVLMFMAALPLQALAESYDLSVGDISVSADSSGQYVTQTNGVTNQQQTTATVITQSGTGSTDNSISISSSGGATAEVTLSGVNIDVATGSAIDVADGSTATIIVSGDNTAVSRDGSAAAVHVADASLTITGDSGDAVPDVLNADALNSSSGAGIGTNYDEDFPGSINITGSVTVNASSTDGAAIGSGEDGTYEGTVSINNGATVNAKTTDEGAGIGAGEDAGFTSDGKIIIDGATVTAHADEEGAGIGCEDAFYGTIQITNSTVTASGDADASAIGSGDYNGNYGNTYIHDSKLYLSTDYSYGVPLGTGGGQDIYDVFNGNISITGDSQLHFSEVGGQYLVGSSIGTGTVTLGPDVKLYNDDVDPNNPLSGDELKKAIGGKLTILSPDISAEADGFWFEVLKKIQAAQEEDEITIDAGGRVYLPYFVAEAAEEMEVTLIIQWDGGEDVRFDDDSELPETQRHIYFTELKSK